MESEEYEISYRINYDKVARSEIEISSVESGNSPLPTASMLVQYESENENEDALDVIEHLPE
jgi:hypothetical protein